MIKWLSKHITLLTRIRLVYYLVGLETVLLVLYILVSFGNLEDQVESYSYASNQAQLGFQLAVKAEQIQRVADTFIDNGNPEAANQVRYVQDQMEGILSSMDQAQLGTKSDVYLTAIKNHMALYAKTFTQVENQRYRQSFLINDMMTESARIAKTKVKKLTQNMTGDFNQSELTAVKILNQIISAEQKSYLYFSRLDASFFDEALSSINAANTLLLRFSDVIPKSKMDEIQESFTLFEEVLIEAVQRTRGYLYLLNVVMAAEISEILYYSQAISEYKTSKMIHIRSGIEEKLTHVLFSALIFGGAFYLLIMFISSVMGRSVTGPIKQLTDAFHSLANGDLNTQIPRIKSKDEMGQLAQAAEVFKQTNMNTRKLLKEYKSLSGELENKVKQRTEELERKNIELEHLSTTDTLTGVCNRLKLEEHIQQEVAKAERYNMPYSLIMLDIDYFKKVNDEHGHQVGDSVLKGFTSMIQKNVRESDIVGRWGGEEFIISCACTDHESALLLAEKLRKHIEENECAHNISCTASFGVSTYHQGDRLESLISRADDAMYESKSKGRNHITSK